MCLEVLQWNRRTKLPGATIHPILHLLLFACSPQPVVEVVPPIPVAQPGATLPTRELLQNVHTLVMQPNEGVIRIDFDHEQFTADLKTARTPTTYRKIPGLEGELVSLGNSGVPSRIRWDGETLHWSPTYRDHYELPDYVENRVREVWEEVRLGMPNTTFLLDSPHPFDPRVRQSTGETFLRIELPFPWAEAYRIYGRFHSRGGMNALHVYDAESLQRITWGGHDSDEGWRTHLATNNVPLYPDFTEDRPTHRHREHPPYHDQIRRVELALAPDRSTNPSGHFQKSLDCAKGQQRSRTEFAYEWLVPNRHENTQLLKEAVQSCEVELNLWMKLGVQHRGNASSCIRGDLQVLDPANPQAVVWETAFEECKHQPYHRGETIIQALPATLDMSQLIVRFQGEIASVCTDDGWTTAFAEFRVLAQHQHGATLTTPTLEWDCWPGWEHEPLRPYR